MLSVDLTDPRLVVLARGKSLTFRHVAQALMARGKLTQNVVFVDVTGGVTAKAYCLISEAYKHQFCRLPMLTDENKRAALQAGAIMAVRPFAPVDPAAVGTMEDLYANQSFAFHCGSAVIKRPPLRPVTGERLRLYSSLDVLHFPSLDEYLDDIDHNRTTDRAYDIELSDLEWHFLDSIMLRFEQFARNRPVD